MEKAEDTKQRRAAAEKAKLQAANAAERFAQAITGRLADSEESAPQKRHQKPETKDRHNLLPPPEHIGQMLMAANETAPISHAGKSVLEAIKRLDRSFDSSPENSDQPTSGRHVGTMSRAELMVLSEQINIDGNSLRQIYESHLVDEQGLRRLIIEHFQGHDLKKALRQEVIEREIDFERDPDVRDMIPQALPDSGGAGNSHGKDALNALLERAAIKVNDSGEEAAFFKARAMYEAKQLKQHKQQRRIIDLTLAAAITVLVTIIIALFLGSK